MAVSNTLELSHKGPGSVSLKKTKWGLMSRHYREIDFAQSAEIILVIQIFIQSLIVQKWTGWLESATIPHF